MIFFRNTLKRDKFFYVSKLQINYIHFNLKKLSFNLVIQSVWGNCRREQIKYVQRWVSNLWLKVTRSSAILDIVKKLCSLRLHRKFAFYILINMEKLPDRRFARPSVYQHQPRGVDYCPMVEERLSSRGIFK